MQMETSSKERGKKRQEEKKLTCERIAWEVQWNTEQMENRDEKIIKQKEDNEMRNMNNANGRPCPAASLTQRHTAGQPVNSDRCLSLLRSWLWLSATVLKLDICILTSSSDVTLVLFRNKRTLAFWLTHLPVLLWYYRKHQRAQNLNSWPLLFHFCKIYIIAPLV